MDARIASLVLAGAVSLCGCATTTHNPPPTTASTVAGCVDSTGSRIPGTCSSPGHSFSQDDLRRTGQTNVADALGQLDPSLTISH
jgi:hypothetical protein